MAKIFASINQKGGVGKTTTAVSLMAGLTKRGYKVLGVDMDPQCNLSYSVKADVGGTSVLGILTGEVTAKQAIQHTPNGDVIASSKMLSGADAFITKTGKEYSLREALDEVREDYDYIIIDTPPALGILSVNALVACNSVIIPAQADVFSLQGIEELYETIKPVKKYCNPNLQIAGVLLTRYNERTLVSRDMQGLTEQLAATLGAKVFRSTIREGVVVKEAQIAQKSLYDYAPNAKVTSDYEAFPTELLAIKE